MFYQPPLIYFIKSVKERLLLLTTTALWRSLLAAGSCTDYLLVGLYLFYLVALLRVPIVHSYLTGLIRVPAPPCAMAPPLPGRECAAIAEHEGTAKAPGTLIVSPER